MECINIGELDGNSISYNLNSDLLTCKSITVEAKKLEEAYKSSADRVSIQDGLVMRRDEFGITLGCFQIKHPIAKQLIINLKRARNGSKN